VRPRRCRIAHATRPVSGQPSSSESWSRPRARSRRSSWLRCAEAGAGRAVVPAAHGRRHDPARDRRQEVTAVAACARWSWDHHPVVVVGAKRQARQPSRRAWRSPAARRPGLSSCPTGTAQAGARTRGRHFAARPSGLAFAVRPDMPSRPERRKPLAKHLDSVSSPGWPGISMSPLSRSAAAFLIHAAALRAVPGEGKDRREVPPGVQPARHGSRSVPFSSPPAQKKVPSGRGGIGAEISVGDGTTGSHGNQIRQALPDMVQDLEH
jgi:hypothetical protein